MIIQHHDENIDTATGLMKVSVYRPVNVGRYATIIFYSEIFQLTAPIIRTARILAGHGFTVLVPEVFHELNPQGTVLAYDDAGKNKGNADKWAKPLESHDSDTQAMVDFVQKQDYCSGKIAAMGVCIGGHLAYRAALNAQVRSAVCLYATDIHSGDLPSNPGNDSLSRTADIDAELMMVWGKQDPHIPLAARQLIHQTLLATDVVFSWQEFNASHAFMRDEGERYDPALALNIYAQSVAFFNRTLTGC